MRRCPSSFAERTALADSASRALPAIGHVSFTFPKSQRLRKRVEIVGVQRAGIALHSRYFVVVCDASGHGRLGITVSKKVGNAVIRNRVKRLVREFVRTARPVGAPDWLSSHLDVVVIAKRQAATATAQQLWDDLASAGPDMRRLEPAPGLEPSL